MKTLIKTISASSKEDFDKQLQEVFDTSKTIEVIGYQVVARESGCQTWFYCTVKYSH